MGIVKSALTADFIVVSRSFREGAILAEFCRFRAGFAFF